MGETFRTAFCQIGGLRTLTNVALTASAPPSIEAEIKSNLEMHANGCVMVSLRSSQHLHLNTKKVFCVFYTIACCFHSFSVI